MKIFIIVVLILIVAMYLVVDFLELHEYTYSVEYWVYYPEYCHIHRVHKYTDSYSVYLSEEQYESKCGYYIISENGSNKLLRMDKSVVYSSTALIEIIKIDVKRK